MQDLGTITNLERMNGVTIKVTDDDPTPNQVSLTGLPNPVANQNGVVTFVNMAADPAAAPPNSKFTFDIVSVAPSSGALTINIETHQANGTQGFTEPVTLVVELDPNIPGNPAHLVVTPGSIVPKS